MNRVSVGSNCDSVDGHSAFMRLILRKEWPVSRRFDIVLLVIPPRSCLVECI